MNFWEISPIITSGILAALFDMLSLQLSSVKESMRIQSEQQMHTRIIETRQTWKYWSIYKNRKENELFAKHLALVDSPDEYYTVVAYIDLSEFLFHLRKTKNDGYKTFL